MQTCQKEWYWMLSIKTVLHKLITHDKHKHAHCQRWQNGGGKIEVRSGCFGT
jgi:hypothetical protein